MVGIDLFLWRNKFCTSVTTDNCIRPSQNIIMSLYKTYLFLRSHKIFILFTWVTRILLSLAFIPSGLKKIMGLKFTNLDINNPVGFFFEGLYRTGIYWNFLGFVQLLAAVLLLIPRTSLLGAVFYLPIVINILLIVVSMDFSGTPVIVALMLLGNIYLLIWDYPRTKILIQTLLANSI
jgi:uncharacterized membrane protein YphA (DoxX/SURF4 family)